MVYLFNGKTYLKYPFKNTKTTMIDSQKEHELDLFQELNPTPF
jgi:hypothetical protein